MSEFKDRLKFVLIATALVVLIPWACLEYMTWYKFQSYPIPRDQFAEMANSITVGMTEQQVIAQIPDVLPYERVDGLATVIMQPTRDAPFPFTPERLWIRIHYGSIDLVESVEWGDD